MNVSFSKQRIMNVIRYIFFLFLLSFLYAEEECCPGPNTFRASAYHTEGTNIGVKKGYTSVNLFFASSKEYYSLHPFLDLRGHLFNDGQPAFNVGAGARGFSSNTNMVFGGNVYYDYRKTGHLTYNQIGMGVEALGRRWEVRANGYVYVGRNRSSTYNLEFVRFRGHSIYVADRFQYSLPGMDTEVGYHAPSLKFFDYYVGIGPYYFHPRKGDQAIGGKIRFTANISEYFSVEGRVAYDPHFHWTGQGVLTLTIPFGPKLSAERKCPVACSQIRTINERLVQPVSRLEMIPVSSAIQNSIAIDPSTNQPFNVIFVNNLSSSNGTFESPYPTLIQAENASNVQDIVYLFPGDGTTNNQDVGLVMKDFQKFWGTGTEQTLLTTLGTVSIPPLTPNMPVITGSTPLFVVSLANSNEVSGINVIVPDTFAAIGTNNLINGVTAKNNTFSLGTGSAGVANNNFSGFATIQNNQMTGNGSAFSVGVLLNSLNTSQMQGTIATNTIDTVATGVLIQGSGTSNAEITILSNVILNSTNRAILMQPTGSASEEIIIEGNQILKDTNVIAAIQALVNTSNSPFSVYIHNNTIDGGDTGILMINQGGSGPFNFFALNNTISNVGDGIEVDQVPSLGGAMNASIWKNQISPNSNPGFQAIRLLCNGTGSTSFQASVLGNSITGFTQGIQIDNLGASNTFIADVESNSIVSYINNGILCNSSNGSSSLTAANNYIQGTSTSVHGINLQNSASLCTVINSNSLNNPSSGLLGNNTGTGIICMELLNNFSNSTIQLTNGGSTFFLEEPSLTSNTPNPTTSGTITSISLGSCGCSK